MTLPDALAQLQALEEKIIDPAMRRAPEALADLLSDDFLEFTPSGRVYRKDTILAALSASGATAGTEMANDGYDLRPLAEDTFLLTFRNTAKRESGEESHSLRCSIWKHTRDGWKLIFHQGTPTSAPAR